MRLSYAILVHNETDELERLLSFLIDNKRVDDEIVVCDDYSTDLDTIHILTSHPEVDVYQRKLNKDFAAQKNFLDSKAKNEYIINIDADEMLPDGFIENVRLVLESNDVDLLYVPRINTVEGLTHDHIQRWGWTVNERGWINWHDPQGRIYKNVDYMQWVRPVHEHVEGAKTFAHLPATEEWAIIHHKKIDKQEAQNRFYEDIRK